MSQRTAAPTVRFEATLSTIDNSRILLLAEHASDKLPSRAQVAVQGTINGQKFQTVLGPDGTGGHWIKVEEELQHACGLMPGDSARLQIEPTREWPEPDVWNDITPMARWEWVRWVNATDNPETRTRRVEVSLSKMNNGKRRPCCFDLSACTDPKLARNGRLREPAY
jgi:hypothetical protein